MFKSRYLTIFLLLLLSLFGLISNTFAQNLERVAQWDSYSLPAGNFVRFIDKEKGYWFWRPAEWKENKNTNGDQFLSATERGPNLFMFTDDIPEGYGLVNYTSSFLQQIRKNAIKQESLTVRPVSMSGIEARELHFEIEIEKNVVHETIWFAVVGPRAYGFIFIYAPSDEEKFEPYMKRMMETVNIGVAGHWNKEFESLRTSINNPPLPNSELTTAIIAKEIRDSKISKSQWTSQLTELIEKSPSSALDLLTDSDPQVRGVAITYLSKSHIDKIDELLLWATTDPDSYCSVIAANTIAKRGEIGLSELKKHLPTLLDNPGVILRLSAAFNDQKSRQVIYDEAVKTGKLADWVKESLEKLTTSSNSSPLDNKNLNLKSLAAIVDAPTTGATLFPKNSTHYLLAPNFQESLDKFNAALDGIQLETVRDQMTLALIIKTLKGQLATRLKAGNNNDVSSVLGINLKAPLSLAAWPKDNKPENISSNSAVVVRISDKDRFERSLALYQNQFGSFDSFVPVSATIARIAGTIPALIPIALVTMAANYKGGLEETREIKPTSKEIYFQHQAIDNLPLTAIERVAFFESKQTQYSTIFILYLGDTAIVASSKEAIIDILQAATEQTTISSNEAFSKTTAQSGEILFFSHLGQLVKIYNSTLQTTQNPFVEGLNSLIGDEIGSLQLNKSSCETLFHLNLSNQSFASVINSFKPSDLKAPENLLPNSTIFYAGMSFEAQKLWDLLKVSFEATDKHGKTHMTASDIEFEKKLIPNLQGEIAFAVLSVKPIVVKPENKSNDSTKLPAMVLALKLKDSSLASLFRENKVFKNSKRLSDTTLNAPIATFDKEQFVFTVTDQYLIVADSIETLKLLEKNEKFASTRDYMRSAKAISNNISLFATYNLDSAFDEAINLSADNPNAKQILSVMSAMLHSFHSQHASVAINGTTLEGSLAVAFDREGRYSVGELAEQSKEFGVANAIISAKGVDIVQSERVESLKLRVKTKPEIIARVQDDIKKFPWQQIEANNSDSNSDGALILHTTARQIPNNQSITLPVTAEEFAPYLGSTKRINSNAPQIIELAKQIVGEDRDSRSVARKIGDWTYHNLKWKKVESDTIQTLTSREADCLEHSELYVALARASGLPARVVTGAALSGGSFGAHAWVEVYLGKWVEVDPTWGLMDYVDATHLRFEDDTFVSYAMLNQIELEVLEVHPFIAEFQRDPVQLITTITSKASKVFAETAFDLALTSETVLGKDGLLKLNEKQRASVVSSFEHMVTKQLETLQDSVQVLKSEIKGDEATVFALEDRTDKLLRFNLIRRSNAWYINEIEVVDYGVAILADSIKSALEVRLPIISLIEKSDNDSALTQVDKLLANNLANNSSQAPLLLLKATILQERELRKVLKNKVAETEEKPDFHASQEILQQLTTRWPNFAASYWLISKQFSSQDGNLDENLKQVIAPLQKYAQLVPVDPRPWAEIGSTFEKLKQFSEAESAYNEAISRDKKNYLQYTTITDLYIKMGNVEKAKESFTTALSVAPNADKAFDALSFLYNDSENDLQTAETMLSNFQQQLSISKSGLRLLSQTQTKQQKYEAALKTAEQVLALKEDSDDYVSVAYLNRKLRRFNNVLEVADKAIKLDAESSSAYFEKACALAQLGKAKEALTALEKSLELDIDSVIDLDDVDLKPLAKMPKFKALLEKQ